MTGIVVTRDMGAPLHHQIYLVLADGISSGRYAVGEPLPTEEELTHLFGVSRITVRRAMGSLHGAGLVERGAGRRTVVRPKLGRPLRMPMTSVIENIVSYGATTVARVIEFGYVPARGFARERLWDAVDRPVQRAVRVRSQDGVPIMHLTSWVPAALGETFTAGELNRIPMFQLLARAGAEICAAEQLASAALADPLVASRLGVKVGAALIDHRTLMIDRKGRGVEYIEMLAVPEHLQMRFKMQAEDVPSKPAASKPTASKPARRKKR